MTAGDAHESTSDSNLSVRFGLGSDRHRLESGEGLILAGVKIPCDLRAIAHSDGDAVLHALADAVLGAAGGTDIGDHFPDDDERWRGMDSSAILREACHWALSAGWKPCQADVVIHLEAPRLADYRDRMKEEIANLLDIPVGCIGLKAKSGEGLGPVGEGLAVDVFAVIQLERAGER